MSPGESGYQVADSDSVRSRRKRLHAAGNHSACLPARCTSLGARATPAAGDVGDLAAAVLEEFPASDRMSRALAMRLVELAAGPGVGGVSAVKALGELVASQRGDQ